VAEGYLYDYDEAALMTGYSPETVACYCKRGLLQRNRDWVIREYRYGVYRRRKRYLTRVGVMHLLLRPWADHSRGTHEGGP